MTCFILSQLATYHSRISQSYQRHASTRSNRVGALTFDTEIIHLLSLVKQTSLIQLRCPCVNDDAMHLSSRMATAPSYTQNELVCHVLDIPQDDTGIVAAGDKKLAIVGHVTRRDRSFVQFRQHARPIASKHPSIEQLTCSAGRRRSARLKMNI